MLSIVHIRYPEIAIISNEATISEVPAMFADMATWFHIVSGVPNDRGFERCLRFDGVGSIQPLRDSPFVVIKSMQCHDFSSVLPQERHLRS